MPADTLENALSAIVHLKQTKQSAAIVRAEYENARRLILAPVAQALEALEATFGTLLKANEEQVELAEAEVKTAVLAHGNSVTFGGIQAVHVAGRVTWDGKLLDGYAAAHPEIKPFRKVGAPYVTLKVA